MRRLIFGVLLVPLFIGLLMVFFGIDHTLGERQLVDEGRFVWMVFAGAAPLTLVTTFLLTRQLGGKITFHWFYLLGLACLGFALAEVLHELGRDHPPDPYDLLAYQMLARIFTAVATLILGLLFLVAAVIQDLLIPRMSTQRPKDPVQGQSSNARLQHR